MAARFETGIKISSFLEFIIAQFQNFTEIQKKLFSEVITLVKSILLLPATNAISEHSSSILTLIKLIGCVNNNQKRPLRKIT